MYVFLVDGYPGATASAQAPWFDAAAFPTEPSSPSAHCAARSSPKTVFAPFHDIIAHGIPEFPFLETRDAKAKLGDGDLDKILRQGELWTVS